jgi:hypothetical protein
MKEITIENKRTITKYETNDGKTFGRKDLAEIHEKWLELKEKEKLIKHIDNAYYCKTQEDFDKKLKPSGINITLEGATLVTQC